MFDPESTTHILARCIEEYQEHGDLALERACREHPELADRIRSAAGALRELLSAASADGEPLPDMDGVTRKSLGRKGLGRFSLGDKLGQGGMGAVYEAFDPVLKRKVAIKVFSTPMPHSEALLERFRREGEALAKTRHPHIVPVLEVGESEDQQPYLAMQFIEGSNLGAILGELNAEKPRLPRCWERAHQGDDGRTMARILADIADAVEHVHAQGLIHRDIKPGNILIDEDGRAILIDFGVARILNDEGMTLSGSRLGTPAFMAPEQIRNPAAVGARTDVYGLGATLYQCLTLHLPFDARSQEEFYSMICLRDPVAPRKVRSGISRDLETICLRAMEKDPARRYRSAAGFRDELLRFLEDRPIRARPLGPFMRTVRWTRRNRAAALALLLALGAVVLGPSSYAFYMGSIAAQERIAKEEIARESGLKEKAQAMAAYRAGRLLAQRGHWAEALVEYEAARSRHPDPVLVAIGRIEALEGNLDVPAAMRELEVLREHPISDKYEARLLLLEADLGVNRLADPDAKMELVDRAIAMNTLEPADQLYAKSMKADSVAEALGLLRRARRYDPNHRRINDSFGVLLTVSGKRRELAQFCRELRAIYPDDPTTSLMEKLVDVLLAQDLGARVVPQKPERPYTKGQLVMLDFIDRASRFIRRYDKVMRDQLLDAVLGREVKARAKAIILEQIMGVALEGSRLMKTQRRSVSGKKTYFRVPPVVSRTLSNVLKAGIRVLASSLFAKPDSGAMIRQPDEAGQKLGDAVYAHGAGMWCLKERRLEEAEKRFVRATKATSLVLERRTSLLYLTYTRCSLYRETRNAGQKKPELAAMYRAKAMQSIREILGSGVLSSDEYHFLFEQARGLGAEELALHLALAWREREPLSELSEQAKSTALEALARTQRASGAEALQDDARKR